MIAIKDRVRFVETDLMGVVHHSNYLRWFEMARVEYLRRANVLLPELIAAGSCFRLRMSSANISSRPILMKSSAWKQN